MCHVLLMYLSLIILHKKAFDPWSSSQTSRSHCGRENYLSVVACFRFAPRTLSEINDHTLCVLLILSSIWEKINWVLFQLISSDFEVWPSHFWRTRSPSKPFRQQWEKTSSFKGSRCRRTSHAMRQIVATLAVLLLVLYWDWKSSIVSSE